MTAFVDDPAEVTPAWLTEVLRAGGADVEVARLRFEPIGTGQTGASYRFHLDVRPERGGADARVPRTVVLKMAAGPEKVRKRLAPGYRSEVGFYRTFASSAAIRVPRCWSAEMSPDARSFTLVLEDAHPALPGRQTEGCTLAQATAAVRNLAGLHASFWNDERLDHGSSWLRSLDASGMAIMAKMLAKATAAFVDRYRAELSPEDVDTLHRTAGAVADWGRHTFTRRTLIHGDYRLDNLMFGPEDDVLAVDWQTLEAGFPARDLAYFLSTALPPEIRRPHEEVLVGAYHERLVHHGVADYPAELCFDDYRRGMLQGPLITVIGCISASGPRTADSDRMFLSMAAHTCAAIRELGTLDLLSA
ncbi:phosphotransferase [Actinomadura rugatobispora]|uniref:Phosphotransferase n=1 Tax=Actinomadura rugatobispora TaxID=1994 RepID=A0ABW1A190_9ACTN|nr:phosphotransferase [Actinomadura rugatobispora]